MPMVPEKIQGDAPRHLHTIAQPPSSKHDHVTTNARTKRRKDSLTSRSQASVLPSAYSYGSDIRSPSESPLNISSLNNPVSNSHLEKDSRHPVRHQVLHQVVRSAPPSSPPLGPDYAIMSGTPYTTTTEQPQRKLGMSVVGGGNRNAKNIPYDQKGEREWSNGICSCFSDFGTCFLALCCPCIIYSQNKSRLEHLDQKGSPHPDGGDTCTGDCCCYAALGTFGFGWVLQMATRAAVRSRYRILGGGFSDCCAAWCCTPCELTQESQEIELEEHSFVRHP